MGMFTVYMIVHDMEKEYKEKHFPLSDRTRGHHITLEGGKEQTEVFHTACN